MRRREFIAGLGATAAWPMIARAQQGERTRRIGILHSTARDDIGSPILNRFNIFRRALAGLGWMEDRNIRFDQRWAESPELLPMYAADIVRLAPDAIFVTGSPSLRAIRGATSAIPIVFSAIVDPVGQGFVSSLARPGGNITGFAGAEFGVATKQLELLKRLAPTLDLVAVLFDPASTAAIGSLPEIEAIAPSLLLQVSKAPVRTAEEIERTVTAVARQRTAGLLVQPSPSTALHRALITSLALQRRVPAVYGYRYFVDNGGLASYSADDNESARRAASYVDRIFKGENPRDLPVQLPTKFDLVLNLKTAKAMQLEVPASVLALADEVIE